MLEDVLIELVDESEDCDDWELGDDCDDTSSVHGPIVTPFSLPPVSSAPSLST